MKVSGLDDQLNQAAKVVRMCASELEAARSRVRYSVEDAHAGGFAVGDDLSVTDRSTGGTAVERATRQTQAEMFAADIRQRAAQLVALDQKVAGTIGTALAGIGNISFDEATTEPGSRAPATMEHNGIQLVDWKQTPTPDVPPGPRAQDIRDAIKDLPRGTRPDIREVRSEEDLRRFWEWISKDGSEYTSPNPYRGGLGIERQLSDGTRVRIGDSKKFGTTMDITLPNGDDIRLHFNPARGGELNFPKQPGEPPARAAVPEPPARAPAPRRVETPQARPASLPATKPPPAILGPVPQESIPHPAHLPHSHHGPPVLGKDELSDLPEFDPG
jgi:hypothetical protein